MSAPILVDQYFALLRRVGAEDFWHPELEALRQQMTEEERDTVIARLQEEGEAAIKEAEELEEFGRRKGFRRKPMKPVLAARLAN